MLVIYLTGGYPSRYRTIQALKVLHEEKVSLVELGVPFSDPLADGPTIQNASFQALENGINLDSIFEMVEEARVEVGAENLAAADYGLNNIILFTYFNPVFAYGIERLAEKCQEHGIKGLLVPDLPLEEADRLKDILDSYGLTLTLLVAITSSKERVHKIAKVSEPFIYLVSRIGITGSKSDIADLDNARDDTYQENLLIEKINEIREAAPKKPIGIGFGIDSPEKVQDCYDRGIEMAIIGSKAIKVLEQDGSDDLNQFREFLQSVSVKSLSSH